MTSKAQIKATRNYEKRNRDKTRYDTAKRAARRFVSPEKGSAMEKAIKTYGAPFYYDDLKDFRLLIEQRLNELEK